MTARGRTPEATCECTLVNERGLHARAATAFVRTAKRFQADVRVAAGDGDVSGRSVMDLLTLAAVRGTALRIHARGTDAARAIGALERLVVDGFGEDTGE